MAISQKKLDRLLAESIADITKEPDFLRALLDAMLFVHTPVGPGSGNLRLVQFRTPDGVMAIPVFTDREKADFAARGNVRVVSLLGRQLFEATRGATFALNPNNDWCLIFPEEVAELLASGSAAVIHVETLPQDAPVATSVPETPPHWLIETLQAAFIEQPSVDRAYLVEMRLASNMDESRLIVAIVMPKECELQVSRAAVTAVQLRFPNPGCTIDLTRVDPDAELPAWLAGPAPEPFYRREWAQALRDGPLSTT